ncbi:MAG: SUF system Fe-S cluster assembly protein [Alphaproteobacteria bacterium]|nr:SUF system Fe-S cluster assembly protein [Alphaproteobacteria bacterium]
METQIVPRSAVETASGGDAGSRRRLEAKELYEAVVAALRTVFDPEIPVNIYDLGLVYRVDIVDRRHVDVDMTQTAPGCPVAGEMMNMAKRAIDGVEGVESSKVNLVFDPPWSQDMMSEEAKLELGFF